MMFIRICVLLFVVGFITSAAHLHGYHQGFSDAFEGAESVLSKCLDLVGNR